MVNKRLVNGPNLSFYYNDVYCKRGCVHEHEHGTQTTIHKLFRDLTKTRKNPFQKGARGKCVHIMCTHSVKIALWDYCNTRCVHTSFLPFFRGDSVGI